MSHKLRPFKHYILSKRIQNVRILKGLPWLIHTNYVEEKQTGLLSDKQFKVQALTSWMSTILFRKRQKKGNKTYTLMGKKSKSCVGT